MTRLRLSRLALPLLLAASLPAAPVPDRPDPLPWLRAAADPALSRGLLAIREKQARRAAAAARGEMVALLRELVDRNSGSRNPEGIRAVLEVLQAELEPLGFRFEWLAPTELGGPHLVARKDGEGRRLLLCGHVDTVFERGHSFQRLRIEGESARGPGVRDMKGGIVIMVQTLKLLHGLGRLADRPVTVILNGDEETGSLSSRSLIEREARRAHAGLIFEGSHADTVTTSRGGLGQARFTIEGKPAHVASRPGSVDANQELAEKMVRLLGLNDPTRKTYVNVAPIQGGIKRNQVSGRAQGEIDLRFQSVAEGERLEREVRRILGTSYVHNGRIGRSSRTRYQLRLHRPPFAESEAIRALADVFDAALRPLGRRIRRRSSVGGSDQNLMAATGLPCLDSLGIDGRGAHTVHETADLSSLVPATERAALAILRLWAADSRVPLEGEEDLVGAQ